MRDEPRPRTWAEALKESGLMRTPLSPVGPPSWMGNRRGDDNCTFFMTWLYLAEMESSVRWYHDLAN